MFTKLQLATLGLEETKRQARESSCSLGERNVDRSSKGTGPGVSGLPRGVRDESLTRERYHLLLLQGSPSSTMTRPGKLNDRTSQTSQSL